MKKTKFTVLFVLLLATSGVAQTIDGNSKFGNRGQSRDYSSVFSFDRSPSEQMNTVVRAEDAKKDIDLWFEWLHSMHPDLSYTVKDIDKFYAAVTQIKDGINAPLTVLEFWRRISVLNSHLSDGHLVAGNPGADYLKDYVAKGGTLFPFEVVFDGAGLVITGQLGGANPSDLSGYTILKINKMPVEKIVGELLLRMNGDSDEHRKAMVQRRFAYFFMLLYGESKQFEIVAMKDKSVKTVTAASSKSLPAVYQTVESFADNFQFKVLDDKNALLTINTFVWEKKQEYFDFIKSAFSTVKTKNIRHLIIDIRNNSGGDDDMWREILKYIAGKPYKWGSKYRKRILAKYRDEGQVIGQVVSGEIEDQIPVAPDSQNRFDGKVSILIGPYTYSSAILFINTVQDNGFGQLVGGATGGKSGQSGGIQFLTLPNTGLRMVCPRFILERPNGGKMKEPVKPDIEINYDKTRPFDLINKLLENSPK